MAQKHSSAPTNERATSSAGLANRQWLRDRRKRSRLKGAPPPGPKGATQVGKRKKWKCEGVILWPVFAPSKTLQKWAVLEPAIILPPRTHPQEQLF
jgi:hypothetical protein